VKLSDAARAGIRDFFDKAFQDALGRYEREKSFRSGLYHLVKPEALSAQVLDRLLAFVEGRLDKFETDQPLMDYVRNKDSFGEWFSPPGVRLIHVVRLAYAFHDMDVTLLNEGLSWLNLHDLEIYRSRCKPPFGLRELEAAVTSLPEVKPEAVALAYLAHNSGWSRFCDWEPDAVRFLFAQRLDLLRDLLMSTGKKQTEESFRNNPAPRRNAFKLLGMFPRLPEDLVRLLWDLALGNSKPLRPLAQEALIQVPDKLPRIVAALQNGQQDIRCSAAEWLGRLGDQKAAKPLKQAFLVEKQEMVKGAILTALERLGADVNEFLDRDALLTQAEIGLKKMPKSLAWLPLHELPILHWRDSGQEVDRRIVRWWVVQSIQHKSHVSGPLLGRYLALCRPHETAQMARAILATWIARDTRTPSHEEAAEKAKRSANVAWSQDPETVKYFYGSKEKLYRRYLQDNSKKCLGSAMPEKGMLAIVSAAGDGVCAKSCETYVRNWCSTRTAQSKILLEILAWMMHPLAIQVLLGFANRFRKKMVQKAARAHVQAMAEREGWTLDELADRSIPDAGLVRPTDESGRPTRKENGRPQSLISGGTCLTISSYVRKRTSSVTCAGRWGTARWFTVTASPSPLWAWKRLLNSAVASFNPSKGVVALISLHFLPLKENRDWDAYREDRLELGKVPPVLLNECHNDIRQIAAEGTGFDRNWQKKISF